MKTMVGAIEAGGTKFVCGVGSGPEDLRTTQFATETPEKTFKKVVEYFSPYRNQLRAIGVGSFGPVDLDPASPTYGFITNTPKKYWANTDFANYLEQEFKVPVAFDTDVNTAALGEYKWGAGKGVETLLYITVGTGVGGGLLLNGRPHHGLVHPELGHMRMKKLPEDTFSGNCPFHQDACLEGLCSGPAIEARWGCPGESLPDDHPAWVMQARYLGEALSSLVCTLSPQRIILGGGVMSRPGMMHGIRSELKRALNGYVHHPLLLNCLEKYLVMPGLKGGAGVLGAMALAQELSNDNSQPMKSA